MGGQAFNNVVPVPQERVESITQHLIHSLGSPTFKLLGSTGKKEFSGDIDIGIDANSWEYEKLVARLIVVMGFDNVNTQGRNLNQVYTRYYDDVTDSNYQVDFMLGNVNLLSFTHWSPLPFTSTYTGSHRTELIKAVAKVLSPDQVFIGDRMIARVGYTLHHDRGLVFGARWCPPRKDGNGYTTKMVAVSNDTIAEFRNEFPSVTYRGSRVITDPFAITTTIFGDGTSPFMLNSYETVAEVIGLRPQLKSQADLIWRLYTKRLDEIKLPHPERRI